MKRIYLLFLPLLAGLFAFQTPDVNTSVEIAAVQTWWQNSSHANTSFLGYTLQPDWSGAQVSKPAADRLIIDIPLIGGGLFDIAKQNPQTGQINPAHKNGATRLVITKIGNSNYIPLLFHAFGTPEYITEHGVQAANMVKSHAVPSNFTGNLFYTRLDGEAFFGIFVENGQVKGTLTPVQPGSVTPRSCSLIETICAGYGEYILCLHFVLCEVFDGPGGVIIIGGNNGSWWGNGPIEDCYGCIGGGFVPPLCPDGSLMSPEDGCPTIIEDDGTCKLTNTYVSAHGPFVSEFFIAGIIPYPWDAFADVLGRLTDCVEGEAEWDMIIRDQTGGITLGEFSVLETEKNNYLSTKTWGIRTTNYAQFIFEVYYLGLKFSSVASAQNEAFFPLKYK
jgi:hypothetical protein